MLRELLSDVRTSANETGVEVLTNTANWLEWALETLEERNLYHKRQRLKRMFFIKYAEEQLAPDELEAINKQVDRLIELEEEKNAAVVAAANPNPSSDPHLLQLGENADEQVVEEEDWRPEGTPE